MSKSTCRRTTAGLAVALIALAVAPVPSAHANSWWRPPKSLTWYWQLTGSQKSKPVQAVDIDGFDNSAATVAALHQRGQRVICYVDVGTGENWRPDWSRIPQRDLGSADPGWHGENWLNIADPQIRTIMAARFRICQQKGFDAVEPDNMDGYQNSTGFPLSAADQLAYDEWVARSVHSLGMAVLEKNDPDQAGQLQPHFDGVLTEQCNQDGSCSAYQPYLAAGKPVLDAEYSGSGFCSSDQPAGIMGALFSQSLDGSVYQPCFGPSASTGPIQTGGGSGGSKPKGTSYQIVGLGSGALRLTHGRVQVSIACSPRVASCTGRVRVSTVHTYRLSAHRRAHVLLGQASFRIPRGRRVRVSLSISSRAVRTLGRVSRVAVLVSFTGGAQLRAANGQRTLKLR